MKTHHIHFKNASFRQISLGTFLMIALFGLLIPAALAQEEWPPFPHLKAATSAEDIAPLPESISAERDPQGNWRCTFKFRPTSEATRVAVCGSFNGWDHTATSMQSTHNDGNWTAEVVLPTGAYEYKFLVNGDTWVNDPGNREKVPDGFGGHNSSLRLGKLAQMQTSDATRGDGQIEVVGLQHRPGLPLSVQVLDGGQLSIRYRTLSHDVDQVALALRGKPAVSMHPVCVGPLFTYWEVRLPAEEATQAKTPNVRSLEYTFVLTDGAVQACDPYPYRHTYVDSAQFETPEWAQNAVWYQIMVDRFRNGSAQNDPDPVRAWTSDWFEPAEWEGKDGQTFYNSYVFQRFYGGDLQGLEEKLPYLKELGVNAIYLMPIFESPSNHKYDVTNYLHVDDNFGTRGDYQKVVANENLLDPSTWQWTASDKQFLRFLERAHQMGFHVIIDGVFNHVGTEHPAFVDVQKNGRQSRFANWFQVISWEPFHYKGWSDFQHMPVLRKSRNGFASEDLERHIFAITKRWMDPNGDGDPSDGVDGWRLDVPSDIPRAFWARWRQLVKETNPNALVAGELWHRADEWLDGHYFDSVMNYEFARAAVKWIFDRQTRIPASVLDARLAELRLAYPKAASYALLNLVDGHDTDRMASMALNPDREYDRDNRGRGGEDEYDNSKPSPEAYARARLATLLQMTYVGAPLVYYGDEAGMWGADDPTNRKPMLWKDLEPYARPEENVVMDDMLEFYRAAIALRNAHPALQRGTIETVLADDEADVWVFRRTLDGDDLLVALNPTDAAREVTLTLPAGAPANWATEFAYGAADGQAYTANGGKLTIQVPAVGGVVLKSVGQ